MIEKKLDLLDDMNASDWLMLGLIVAGVVVAVWGLGEVASSMFGAVSGYASKGVVDARKRRNDAVSSTDAAMGDLHRAERDIYQGRDMHDAMVAESRDVAENVVRDADLDDLIDAANAICERRRAEVGN